MVCLSSLFLRLVVMVELRNFIAQIKALTSISLIPHLVISKAWMSSMVMGQVQLRIFNTFQILRQELKIKSRNLRLSAQLFVMKAEEYIKGSNFNLSLIILISHVTK
jgi:hypothetical protein